MKKYDIVVIGAGHAGIEAAYSAAKLGCSVLLLTIDIDGIGKLSCNPAVGGVSKGHLVREVDALGGLIARITDQSALGYRILNRSKGKAVWSTRAQVDMYTYPKVARCFLESTDNIEILQAKVERILVKNKKVYGVQTNFGEIFETKAIVICAGTFLKSKIHIGLNSFPGGRLYEESSDSLFDNIKNLGFEVKHFKTGTCARLDKRTIDFSKMIEQKPDKDVVPFSFHNKKINPDRNRLSLDGHKISNGVNKKSLSCFITHTNKKTHKVILNNLKYSPLYTGKIHSTGVRYCPSLEDKVIRFSQRDRHQVFIEPQGLNCIEVYPNGISTSLPLNVQLKFIRTIEGLEKTLVLRPGYGIEHGLINPCQLDRSLESKKISGLYFAGQVNGTTGYEEAAAQGLIAGINAALRVKKKSPFILERSQAYIGVLIDDLTAKGVDEPYRMFTSRCEFRLTLRESNTSMRLAGIGYKLGLINKSDYEVIVDKKNRLDEEMKKVKTQRIIFKGRKILISEALKRPKVSFKDIKKYLKEKIDDLEIQREIEILAKYEGFLRREQSWLKELRNIDKIKIPKIDFFQVPSLSREVQEKLEKFKPKTLAQALKISGITPAAILNIYNFIKRR
ncbi:MAG: tRNA uridine-5-carboxymethylaminomethyl(34) synthesis enzyme MnmG [Candidatus Omnitrophota bacterium]